MSTLDLETNKWTRTTTTPTGLDYWVTALEPAKPAVVIDDPDCDLEPYDPERRELPDGFWDEWLAVWR